MQLDLHRFEIMPAYTLGRLSIDGVVTCFTLEDAVREGPKLAHETAIPAGRYPVTITRSQRFNALRPLVSNVPGFEGIRIHPGNTTADVSGCILVGRRDKDSSRLLDSRITMDVVQSAIARALAASESVWLTVTNEGTPNA